MRILVQLAAMATLCAMPLAAAPQKPKTPFAGPIETLLADLAAGRTTSEAEVKRYLTRIASVDDAGPRLNAVLALMPDAVAEARIRDVERKSGKLRGALHGVPILIKDNIEAAGPVPTTAGSLALAENVTGRDAALVARLKAAGAIIIGKTNLSEWANIRSNDSTSGWSAIGGFTRNPHVRDRTPCGSSSGSGAAMAAGLAAGTIGTETDGSITCPSSINGIVGFKPTLGLVSRRHIVPISHSQDTAGPMTQTVWDAALMLNAIAGTDAQDADTQEADARKTDYVAAIKAGSLKGLRIGVMRDRVGNNAKILALFHRALAIMKNAGADIVEIRDTRKGMDALGEAEFAVLLHELKADLNAYLLTTPKTVKSRSLADVIAFNKANAAREMKWFGQETFELAQQKGDLKDPAYVSARERSRKLAGPDGIDRFLKEYKVDLLVGVTNGLAWPVDPVNGDSFSGPSASQLPAVAGYPHLTVPMGAVNGLPTGISFIGTKWDDARVLAAGYAYEQLSRARVTPRYLSTVDVQ